MDLPDEPTWDVIGRLASGGALSETGHRVVRDLLTDVKTILGEEFPARTFRKFRGLPPEFLLSASHRSVLPMFLTFALHLRDAASEPTFRPVLNGAVDGVDIPAWYHLRLQLEAARACRAMDVSVTYEPDIPGTDRKADLLVDADRAPWLVEVTAILRGDADKSWERYEDAIKRAVRGIEHRHDVNCVVSLDSHPLDAAGDGGLGRTTEVWLATAERAAAAARTTRAPQIVRADHGWIAVYPESVPAGTTTFSGAVQERDGWKRLRRALAGKARQIDGPLPVWVRIDCRDGLFQFTDWPRLPPPDRIAAMAEAISSDVSWPSCAQGVVLSSGDATSLGATSAEAETVTADTNQGTFLRRLTAPGLLRETVILPFGPAAHITAQQWRDAYDKEPQWLDTDLAAAGMPLLADFWTYGPAAGR
ncbi:hypothetical protein [Mangrovihabitans endophyticus]|uniref:Uncharacterized protein n=1 Tax=Mangrovihabitans endophyticus TaxID=1751298 RepID=A0A8J3C373_9ACTN|nr:hypothetical protein [Mangrovihabitans endophyticus]GGL11969.1 hypothetical protein GCM10012284_53390 [Mangrovihabitans endophyticus]